MRYLTLTLSCLFAATLAAQSAPSDGPGYSLAKKIDIGGQGLWDYLTYDSVNHHVFVSRAFHVLVFDGDSGAAVGEIPNTPGVHGIAIAPDLNRGFTSNGQTSTVTIFDLKTLQRIGEAPTGGHPDAIIYDPASKRVFTMNANGVSATAIDAASGQPVGTVPLPGRPEFAVADGKGTVFANITTKHSLVAIDSQKVSIKSEWDMPGCEGPSGLSMDRVNRRLFAGCDNRVIAVMDADSGKEVALVPAGSGIDATAFDPKTGFAFSPNGEDGTLTVVHEDSPDHFSVAQTVQTELGARTMALDEDTGTVYLVTASGEVREILSFLLGVFRFAVRPAFAVLGLLSLLAFVLVSRRVRSHGRTRGRIIWASLFGVFAVLLLVGFAAYDPIVLALSPRDFHMSIWKPAQTQTAEGAIGRPLS
jgi:DNA-binding beta-propeller fold protein YncE